MSWLLWIVLLWDAVKVLHSVCRQIWKTQQWPQTGKGQFSFQSQERQCQRMLNYHTIELISLLSKVMFKILQARLQQYVNHEFPDVQAGFRKGKRNRDQIANICWITEKARRVPEKYLFLLYWLCQSLWLCGSQQTVENSSRDVNTRPPYVPSENSVCRSRSNS